MRGTVAGWNMCVWGVWGVGLSGVNVEVTDEVAVPTVSS